jgi:TalC/MipB family fructose-6-phosphate aldolase
MALYIDSAYLDDIISVVQAIPVAGITTNPTILLAARERGQKLSIPNLIKEMQRIVAGFIFVQPGELDEEKMLQEVLSYVELDPQHVIPKIPMTQTGMRVALRLRKIQKQQIAFTAVTSVAQAYSAAMVGAAFIIPYYNRLERSGIDASERVSEMAELLHNQQLSSRLLAASIKTPAEATSALLAGAHDLTIAPQVLLEMTKDSLSEEAIEKFGQDWQKMKKL